MNMYIQPPSYHGLLITEPLYYTAIVAAAQAGHVTFDRTILDEGDSLTWFLRGQVPSSIVWLLTAKYSGGAQHTMVRLDPAFSEATMRLPQPLVTSITCRDTVVTNVLAHFLTGDQLESAYGADFTFAQNLHRVQTVDNSREAVKLLLESASAQVDALKNEALDEERLRLLDTARARMTLIRDRLTVSRMCNICLEDLSDIEVSTACCKNLLCHDCVRRLRSDVCPMCRAPAFQIVVVFAQPERAPVEALPTKIDTLEERVCRPGKHLVFSNFPRVYEELRPRLSARGIHHVSLDGGNRRDIDAAVAEYKTGSASVMLVDSSFFGRGLNLENTTDVTIFHRLRQEDWNQVVGRAQRLGRKGELRVWQLVYEGEQAQSAFTGSAGF